MVKERALAPFGYY